MNEQTSEFSVVTSGYSVPISSIPHADWDPTPDPCDVVAVARIAQLVSAIGRYIGKKPLNRELLSLVKLWVVELSKQVELLDTYLIYHPKDE